MPHALVLTDLDDTLFSTKSKCEEGTLVQATQSGNGRHSYMDKTQQAFFDSLKNIGAVVPVTARGSASFDNVLIDFEHKAAILANGAIIRDPNGHVDMKWFETIKNIGAKRGGDLKALETIIAQNHTPKVRLWVQEELGVPVYLIVKVNKTDIASYENAEATLRAIKDEISETDYVRDCMVHLNGNNLTITPHGISKKEAVAYFMAHHFSDAQLSYGVGDSKTDMPFMSLCDITMIPRKSQILKQFITE
jgi:HAD superfamily hydrolase (TIGR01484 family)